MMHLWLGAVFLLRFGGLREDIFRILDLAVRWIGVPATLILMFLLAIKMTSWKAPTQNEKWSKFFGLCFGVAAWVWIMIANDVTNWFDNKRVFSALGATWRFGVYGAATALVILALSNSLVRTRAISLFIALVSFASLSGLYFYFSVDESRSPILLYLVSLITTACGYVMLFPDALLAFRTSRQTSAERGAPRMNRG